MSMKTVQMQELELSWRLNIFKVGNFPWNQYGRRKMAFQMAEKT